MRIVHVTNDLDRGGVQTYLAQLLPALKARGHAVAAVLVSGQGQLVGELEREGIPYLPLAAIGRRGALKWPRPGAVARLARWLAEWQADIVHTHLFLGNTIGRLAALQAQVPVVLATEHSTYFGKRWPSRAIDRWLAARTDGVLAVSGAVAAHLVATEGIPATRIRVLPHGVTPAARALPPPPPPPRLGIVGRLHPDKGHRLFLQVLAALREQDGGQTQGYVLGDGPERDRLQALAAQLGLVPDGVRFLGWRRDLERWWPNLHALLAPSRREGFGLAALEAMAVGLPVVLSDIPAFRELTEQGRHGALVPLEGDRAVVAWRDAVRRTLKEDGAAAREARRAYVERRFGFARHLQGLEALYREFHGNKRGALA